MSSTSFDRRLFMGGSVLLGGGLVAGKTRWARAAPLGDTVRNHTQVENARAPGFATPGGWAIQGNRSTCVSAFAGPESIERGQPLTLRLCSFDQNHDGVTPDIQRIDIYRMGWYGGFGARLVTSTTRTSGYAHGFVVPTPPDPIVVASASSLPYGPDILDYSNWYSISFVNTTGWETGMYVAKVTDRYGGQIYAYFVVRPHAIDMHCYDILVPLAFNTYQAYCTGAGNGLYGFNTGNNRACGVSHNRPIDQAMRNPGEYNNMLRSEYAMALWLEREGYAVAYMSDTDFEQQSYDQAPATDMLAHFARNRWPHALLVGGHSEYWSQNAYNAFMTARDTNNTHLMFLSGNTCYWRVHFENRVMYCFKESWRLDPSSTRPPTNLWRSYPNNRPENQLLGVMHVCDDDVFQGNPSSLDPASASDGAIGWEWDTIVQNSTNPIPASINAAGEGIGPGGRYDRYDSAGGSAPYTDYDVGQHHLFANQVPSAGDERTAPPPGSAFPLLLGMRFRVAKAGQLINARYWRSPNETGAAYISLWNADTGALITAVQASAAGPNQSWWTAVFGGGLRLAAGTTYTIAVIVNNAYYSKANLLDAPGQTYYPIQNLPPTNPNEIPQRRLPLTCGVNLGVESTNAVEILEGSTGCVYGTYTSDSQPAPSLVEANRPWYFLDVAFVPDGTVPNDSLASSTAIGWPSRNGHARTFASGSVYWAFALSATKAGDLSDSRGDNGAGIQAAVRRQLNTRFGIYPGPSSAT